MGILLKYSPYLLPWLSYIIVSVIQSFQSCSPSEDSDQPNHSFCMVSDLCLLENRTNVLGNSHPLNLQQKLWTGWMAAQADPSHR